MIPLSINTKKIIYILSIIFFILFILNLATIIQFKLSGQSREEFSHFFFNMFNFEKEKTVPTYFSVVILFLASQTFLIIRLLIGNTAISSYIKHYWTQMSAIFILLSMDEVLMLHERLSNFTKTFIPVERTGFFKYSWVVPMIGLLLVFGLYSIKFLMSIPPKLRNGYIIAGSMFVFGAVGLEMLSGKIDTLNMGRDSLLYLFVMTIEESLEMTGIILLLYFNLNYINELIAETMNSNKKLS